MSLSVEEFALLNDAASHVRLHTGISHVEAVARVKEARDKHGIEAETYVKDRLYLLPARLLEKRSGPNRYVRVAAEEMGIPYQRALAIMTDIRTKYGMGFREFAEHKLYTYGTDADRLEAVRRFIEREGRHVEQVARETGWPLKETEETMRAVKQRWPLIDFRKYKGYGFFNQTDEEIEARLKRWNDTARENRERVAEETGWSVAEARAHITRFQIVYDIIPAYYMCYRGWELSDEQIDGYARQKLSERLSNKYNVKADIDLVGQKDKFNYLFSDYTRRKYWLNTADTSFEEFFSFADGLDEAFCKPLRSGGGLGTFKVDLNVDREALRAAYHDLMSKPLVLVEESVKQHEAVNEFYPTAVNTVRVVTLQDGDDIHIISTGIRFGAEGITDNFSADGMVCDIDTETGVILTSAVNKKGEVYAAHPYSGKEFIGFQVPHWDKVIQTAKDAMCILSGVNYVGWDIAVGPEDVSIIEANSMPDLVLVQAPYAPEKMGKRYLFDPFLEATPKRKPQASSVVLPPRIANPKGSVKPPNQKPASQTPGPDPASKAQAESKHAKPGLEKHGRGVDWKVKRALKYVHKNSLARIALLPEKVRLEDFKWKVEGDRVTIVSYSGTAPKVRIPERIDGKPVRSIGPKTFEGNEDLRTVILPESLEEIGHRSFAKCKNLENVRYPDRLQVVRSQAFLGCRSLRSVSLPDSVTTVYKAAFKGCTSLITAVLPQHLQVLNRSTFEDCTALKSVVLPYDLQRIGTSCFAGCSSLEELYYYSMRGISAVLETDRTLPQHASPIHLSYIGPSAFEGCRSLRRVNIPSATKEILTRTFKDCTALENVGLHNLVTKIGSNAFEGCTTLSTLRVPPLCRSIGAEAFPPNLTLITKEESYPARWAERHGVQWRAPRPVSEVLSSVMVPADKGSMHEPFYSEQALARTVERFEFRTPSYLPVQNSSQSSVVEVPKSRFNFEGGVYRGEASKPGQARLMLVGDVMSRVRQQKVAAEHYNNQFNFSFSFISRLLREADLAVANLETMVSSNAPLSIGAEHVDSRPHLNAPASLLTAIRDAGFDAVINAQNHAYDTGTQGVLETLDETNRNQLMHTGLYVSKEDPRYLVIDVGGIRIGLVAYMDSARQKMKKANFSREGRQTMFPYLNRDTITADIRSAKEGGAEFIIAYAHWGREYTHEVTDRQRRFASLLVEAGADLIFGAHPHCLQPFEYLSAPGRKQVPCLWSGGNFLSDMNIASPITRDSLVLDLTLAREGDQIVIRSIGYHPARIMLLRDGKIRNYAVVPTRSHLGAKDLDADLREAASRIRTVIGPDLKEIRASGEVISQGSRNHAANAIVKSARLIAKKFRPWPVRELLGRQKAERRKPQPREKPSANRQSAPGRSAPLQRTRQISMVGEVREILELNKAALHEIVDTDTFTRISFSPKTTIPGALLFLNDPSEQNITDGISAGATSFVSASPLADEMGNPLPTLIHPQPEEAYIETLAQIRARHDLQVVAVTGSIGKTTVKEMLRLISETHFRTLASERNANVIGYIGTYVQRLKPTTQVYVQETGANFPGLMEKGSRLLQPTAFVITNLGFDHVGDFGGDQHALLNEKLCHDRNLPANGVGFVNRDDPVLKNVKLDHSTIWYSKENPEADYYATDIRENNGQILFNIVDRADGSSTPTILNTYGVHNVSNAVAAYAVGRWLNIPPGKIVRGLAAYKGKGTRQNLVQMGNQRVLVDCFNASQAAVRSTARSLDAMSVENGGRRVLVLADLDDKLGDLTEEIHRRTGAALAAESNADVIALFGEHTGWMAEEARVAGKNVFHTNDRAEFHAFLDQEIHPTDVLAFKGGQQMAMSLTVDWLFGSDFVLEDRDELAKRSTLVDRSGGQYRLIEGYGTVFAGIKDKETATAIRVEPEVEGQPVLMVGRYACARSQLIKVEIPAPVRSLARNAFYMSDKIVEVILPDTLKMIGRSAFRGCHALEKINIPDGVTTINTFAFHSCWSLRTLTLPKSVASLGTGVFAKCENLEVRLPKGSPLERKYPKAFAGVTVSYYT